LGKKLLRGAIFMPLLTHADSTQATIAKKQTRRGAAVMEYVMMLSLIFVACMVAIGYLGTSSSGSISSSSNAINNSLQNGNSSSSNANNNGQQNGNSGSSNSNNNGQQKGK
jgi:uncharacterized protein (UPF0333 family)